MAICFTIPLPFYRKIQLSLKLQTVKFDITVPPLTIHQKTNAENKNEGL